MIFLKKKKQRYIRKIKKKTYNKKNIIVSMKLRKDNDIL